MIAPPVFPFDLGSLPDDDRVRHEKLVELFGDYMMWIRKQTLKHADSSTSSIENCQSIASVSREPYEAIANMNPEDRQKALAFAKIAVDTYARIFLTVLAGTGDDQKLGDQHSAKFRLNLEIHDVASGELVVDETVNRGGKKFFPEYWGRWINKGP